MVTSITAIPRRTITGDLRLINDSDKAWLSSGDQVKAQVFVLSNAALDIKDMAALLQQPEDVIQKAVQTLVNIHCVSLLPEKRRFVSNIDFLRKTFDMITDRTYFARRFYDLMISVFPLVGPLFSNTNWEKQYRALMSSMDKIVMSLKYGRNIVPAIHLLGSRHDCFGVKPEYYAMFNACLLIALQQTLGLRFTIEEQDIWTSTVEILSIEMLKGGRPEIASMLGHILPCNG